MSDEARKKIASAELRRLVEDPELPAQSVLVEIAAAGPSVRVERDETGGRAVGLAESEGPDHAKVETEAREYLETLLSRPVTYLRAARAFVVEARGPELEAICRQRFVRAVHPNRSFP